MKMYLYEYVSNVTTSYHSGGGLVIITDREPLEAWEAHKARLILGEVDGEDEYDLEDLYDLTDELPKPDLVLTVSGAKEKVFTFPDSGCC